MKIAVLLVISCFIAAAYSESLRLPPRPPKHGKDNFDFVPMDAEVESKIGEMIENEDETAEVEGTGRYFWSDYCRCYKYRGHRRRCRIFRYIIRCYAYGRKLCLCRKRY